MQVQFCYANNEEALQQHPITPGSLYVVTDTCSIFFDSDTGERINLGQMEALTNEELDSILV